MYDQFLRPTFEAMFHMLHRSAGDEKLQFLVYDALIFVLGMFAEDRMLLFVNFRPTINSMIQAYEQYVPNPPDACHSIEPHLPVTLSSPLLREGSRFGYARRKGAIGGVRACSPLPRSLREAVL